MRELAFPTPPDSSNVIAETVTVTLEDGTLVRFAHIASTFYVRDESLGIWDRAYMICVAEGYLTYMRSPEVYKGADAMIVHRSPVLSETSDVITSACPLLTPALEQVFQIEPVRPRFFVDEHGAVRAVELFWERIGLRTHSAYDDGTQGRWEEVRPVPVHGELPARHVEIAVVPYPATMVLLEGDGGKIRHDGRVVTDVLECRRGGGLRLQYEGGAEHVKRTWVVATIANLTRSHGGSTAGCLSPSVQNYAQNNETRYRRSKGVFTVRFVIVEK